MGTRENSCSFVEEASKSATSARTSDTEEHMQNSHMDNGEGTQKEHCMPQEDSVESTATEAVKKDACLDSENKVSLESHTTVEEPNSKQSETESFEGSRHSTKDCTCTQEEKRLGDQCKTCHSVALDILPDSRTLEEQGLDLKSPDVCYVEIDGESDSDQEDVCRICHCGNEAEQLISPCLCIGSVKFVHHSCLMSWLQRAVMAKCELCLYPLAVQRKRKPLNKWRLPDEKPIPLIWLMAFVIAMTLNVSSLANDGTQGCTSKPCIVFYVLGSAGALLGMAFFYHWSKKSATYLKKWIAWNQEWRLVGPKDLPATLGHPNLAFSTKSLSGNERSQAQVLDVKVGENLACSTELSTISDTEINQAQVT